jgi:ribosomal protein S18 acetylase RimI-like enzyme
VQVRPTDGGDATWARALLTRSWGDVTVISRGVVHDATTLPGLVAEDDGERVGLLTYHLDGAALEVVTVDAVRPGAGVGTTLLAAVRDVAKNIGARRVWLVTTNDNLAALRFYQRRGLRLMAVHAGAVDLARELKPSIPALGAYGIPLRDELELELPLD